MWNTPNCQGIILQPKLSLFLEEVVIFERFGCDKEAIVAEAGLYFEAKDYSSVVLRRNNSD